MKLVINIGGAWFQLSDEAIAELDAEETSVSYEHEHSLRSDPRLVEVVERLGSRRASGIAGHLIVVEIPDGVNYGIYDHDGREFVFDKDRVWGIPKESKDENG